MTVGGRILGGFSCRGRPCAVRTVVRRSWCKGTDANTRLPTVLLIPLTTQEDALRFPGTVLGEKDVGQRVKSVFRRSGVSTTVLDRRFLGSQLGTVSKSVMQAIWTAFDDLHRAHDPQ